MKTNFFKANINEAELNEFLENELDEQERERFTKILNDENFSLLDNEIKNPRAWDCDSDEAFFCDIVRKYKNKLFNDNRLFNDKKIYAMTANFAYKHCMRLYENDESECMQRSIFNAKKAVWNEYARVLKELARWRYHPSRIKTQEQKKLFSQIIELCDEYCYADGKFKSMLNYERFAFSTTKNKKVEVINDNCVNLIELIKKSAHLLSEIEKTLTSISVDELLSEIDKTDRSLNIHELLELAKSLLKRNIKNKIFTNNNINFKYLYDNDIFLRFYF